MTPSGAKKMGVAARKKADSEQPSFLVRLAVRIFKEWDGLICYPAHGYQFDPLLHGYSDSRRFHECPRGDYRVFTS